MKKSSLILIVLIMVCGLILFLELLNKFNVIVPSDLRVGLKWVNQAQFAGLYSAIEEGFYRQNGLSVSIKEFEPGVDYIDDLLSGKTDFAIISAEEFLINVDEGNKITAIAAIYQVSPYALVSLKDKNINSPADFVGKNLGVKAGKIEEELIYEILLSSFGIPKSDVNIKNVGFNKYEYQDLIDNDVDVIDLYRTDQLYLFDKSNVKYNVIFPERYGVNIYNDLIVTRNDLIQQNPELVSNFISSTIRGWEYVLNNKEKAIENTLKYVTVDMYKDYDYQLNILNKSIPLIKQDAGGKIGLMSLDRWKSLYQTMINKKIIKNKINIEEVFTNRFLE